MASPESWLTMSIQSLMVSKYHELSLKMPRSRPVWSTAERRDRTGAPNCRHCVAIDPPHGAGFAEGSTCRACRQRLARRIIGATMKTAVFGCTGRQGGVEGAYVREDLRRAAGVVEARLRRRGQVPR